MQAVVKLYQSTSDPKLKPILAEIMRSLHSAIPGAKGAARTSPTASPTKSTEGGEEATSQPVSPTVLLKEERVIMLELWDNAIRCEEVEKTALKIKGVISCVSLSETRAVRVIARCVPDIC